MCVCVCVCVCVCARADVHSPQRISAGGRVCLQCGRPRFDFWVRKIPWRREWQLTLVSSCLENSMDRERSLDGLQSAGLQRVGHNWATNTFTFQFHFLVHSFPMRKTEPLLLLLTLSINSQCPHTGNWRPPSSSGFSSKSSSSWISSLSWCMCSEPCQNWVWNMTAGWVPTPQAGYQPLWASVSLWWTGSNKRTDLPGLLWPWN